MHARVKAFKQLRSKTNLPWLFAATAQGLALLTAVLMCNIYYCLLPNKRLDYHLRSFTRYQQSTLHGLEATFF